MCDSPRLFKFDYYVPPSSSEFLQSLSIRSRESGGAKYTLPAKLEMKPAHQPDMVVGRVTFYDKLLNRPAPARPDFFTPPVL